MNESRKSFIALTLASVVGGVVGGVLGVAQAATENGPSHASYAEGRLADCPKSPNCVSTQAPQGEHRIVPFTYSKPLNEAREALKKEMMKVPRTTLVKEDGLYLHYECRSAVFRFTDDVEFIFNEEKKTLEFRSASRIGYSDWGVNRKRMEDIRNRILGRI